MFDIEGEDTGGVKSDVERFVLDYKDGNLYRMCKEEGSSQSVTTLAPTTTTMSGTSPMSNTELTTVTIMMETNVTTVAPTTTSSQVTVGPNELTNEINSSDVNENVRFRVHCGKNDLRKGYLLCLWEDHFLDWGS